MYRGGGGGGGVMINRHYQQLHDFFVHDAVTVIKTTMSSGTVLKGTAIMPR